MNVIVFLLLSLAAFFVALFIFSTLLKRILWAFSPIFFGINSLIWFAYNPFRNHMKNKEKATTNVMFNVFLYTLLVPAYWVLAHLLLTPLRIINALYFDVMLYISVMLGDLVAELFDPKVGGMRYKRKTQITYWTSFITRFPVQLITFFIRGAITLLDSLFMFSMGVVLPTYAMYHGTDFERAISNIGQEGQWKIGGGEYAGRGVYFGLNIKTARHYARGYRKQGIIVARVTLNPIRNISSLSKEDRIRVGSDGGTLSITTSPLWATFEHWRDDEFAKWWEYCLIHRGNVGDYIKTWRIRPVAFLDENGKLTRLWKGQAHYSFNTFKSFVMGIVCTVLVGPFMIFALGLVMAILNI